MIRQTLSFAFFLLLTSFLLESPSESRMVRREASEPTPATAESEEPKAESSPASIERYTERNEAETPEDNEIKGKKPNAESGEEGDEGQEASAGGESGGEGTSAGGESGVEGTSAGGESGGEGASKGEESGGEEAEQGGEPGVGGGPQDGEPGEEYPDEDGDFDHQMIHTGFIFDAPIFSFEAAENYFRQLEMAMHEIFRKAMSEAAEYPDNYKNTTTDEFTINGQKYRIQKTVIKQGGDDNSTLLIKAVSAIPVERKKRALLDSEMWTV